MDWESLQSLFYRYWHYVLFGVLSLALIIVSYYYIQVQFDRRQQRLETVHLYEVTKRGELSPPHADVDPLIGDLLFPRPAVYLPLMETVPVRERWGPLIREWELRVDQPSLQPSPDLLGPS